MKIFGVFQNAVFCRQIRADQQASEKGYHRKVYLQQQGTEIRQIGHSGYACRLFQQGSGLEESV